MHPYMPRMLSFPHSAVGPLDMLCMSDAHRPRHLVHYSLGIARSSRTSSPYMLRTKCRPSSGPLQLHTHRIRYELLHQPPSRALPHSATRKQYTRLRRRSTLHPYRPRMPSFPHSVVDPPNMRCMFGARRPRHSVMHILGIARSSRTSSPCTLRMKHRLRSGRVRPHTHRSRCEHLDR